MKARNDSPKIILVTGASSGIGEATALKLLDEGHFVYGAARRIERMRALEEAGGRALEIDVTDHRASAAAVSRIVAEHGRLDVLVNNAGYAIYGSVEDTGLEDARRQFEVNLFGAAAITRAALPHMRARRSGRIINISSVGGKIYSPLGAWYHATKHALEGWSDCLRLELKPFGVDVIIVEPGAIATEFGEVLLQPMLDRSREGPYAPLAESIARATRRTYDEGDSSPPAVIAEVIARAIAARRPKTRYVAGKFARALLGLRRWLSDRAFDSLIMSQVKRMSSAGGARAHS